MTSKPHLSRREILSSIPVLTFGSSLLPSAGQGAPPQELGVIRGTLRDKATAKAVAAKIHMMNVMTGETYVPVSAIKSVLGMGQDPAAKRYFYTWGNYEVAVPPGAYSIEVVRGICHKPVTTHIEVGAGMTGVRDIDIPLLWDLRSDGWYSGNTHTHYHIVLDGDPDARLRLVPVAEDLDISVISYVVRNESPYITNRYPIGRLPDFSRDGTLVDMGQETRNDSPLLSAGYGHCLFVNIPRIVEPVSTGILSRDGKAPDFPTLSMLCSDAKRIGGTTIWCHNGEGMAMPIAAALGGIDAFNVADGQEADYERYYQLLNCGFRLPISTGTDWWIYDNNRVFVQIEGSFTYDSWIAGLLAGRTFVTNGPLLGFTVSGKGPGSTLKGPQVSKVVARAVSVVPFERLEIVQDGTVVAQQTAWNQQEARLEKEIPVKRSGWIAARVGGNTKTGGGYTVFAHSSPVYLDLEGSPPRHAEAAGKFVDQIEESVRYLRKNYRFGSEADKAEALRQYEQGRMYYAKLVAKG